MKIRLSAIPETGDAQVQLAHTSRITDFTKWTMILTMWQSILDEENPVQDRDANGNLLFIDTSNGTVVTEAQMSHELNAPVYAIKYRPRTEDEVWRDVQKRIVRGIIDAARKRKRDLAQAAINTDDEVVVDSQ